MERSINITESDLEIIVALLLNEESRCRTNAKNTKKGYGTAKSQIKYNEWIDKAERCFELANKISQPFI